MKSTEWLVCRAFIDKKAKETKEALLSFLSAEQKKAFLSLPPLEHDLTIGFDQVRHLLKWCHPSWFTPFLRTLSEEEISLFLGAFPEEQAKELSQLLLFSSPIVSLSPTAKAYLQKKLIENLLTDFPDLLPIEALGASPLNPLLTLSRKGLSLLIEFLGLYDLGLEMRLIIDTIKIRKIQSALSKDKVFFLSLLGNRHEPSLFKKMDLNLWNGKPEDLLTLLHKRGMNRLAKALIPEDPSFIFYIKLRMSTEEEALFSSLHKKSDNSKAYKILTGQIMEVLTFFKKHNLQAAL